MSKKHFAELAARMRKIRNRINDNKVALTVWAEMVKELASFCTNQNSNFDRDRFLSACGLEES